MTFTEQMQELLYAAETDSNLAHQRGYIPPLERLKMLMTTEEAIRFEQVKQRVELAMALSRGITRRRQS